MTQQTIVDFPIARYDCSDRILNRSIKVFAAGCHFTGPVALRHRVSPALPIKFLTLGYALLKLLSISLFFQFKG